MSIQLNERRLAGEIARRGLTQSEFAALAGITAATVTNVMNGKPVRQAILSKMAVALQNCPVVETIDQLVAR